MLALQTLATPMPYARQVPLMVLSLARAPKDTKAQTAPKTSMNAFKVNRRILLNQTRLTFNLHKDRHANTTEFASTFPDHSLATAVKALLDLVVKQTSTSANLIRVKMKEVAWMIPELFDVSACQVSSERFFYLSKCLNMFQLHKQLKGF